MIIAEEKKYLTSITSLYESVKPAFDSKRHILISVTG